MTVVVMYSSESLGCSVLMVGYCGRRRCIWCFFFLMFRRPPRSTQSRSSAASDVYKRQLEAAQAYATLGEICDVLRGVFGEYRPSASAL